MEESHGRGGGEREGRGGVDKEMEGRISAAVCQPRPVGVFIRFQNHRTRFPTSKTPGGKPCCVSLRQLSAPHRLVCHQSGQNSPCLLLIVGRAVADKNTRDATARASKKLFMLNPVYLTLYLNLSWRSSG